MSDLHKDGFVQVRLLTVEGRWCVVKMYETSEAQTEIEALYQELWALAKLESLRVCDMSAFLLILKVTLTFTRSPHSESNTS